MKAANSSEQEFEVSLIIGASEAESIIREIAALKSTGVDRFIRSKTRLIRDCYFDLENNLLLSHGFGLRIRSIDKKQLITLKGKAAKTEWGGIKRLELEFPWSQSAWSQIRQTLVREISELSLEKDFDKLNAPQIFLQKLGFKKIQQQENLRQMRSIVIEHSDLILAELALDSMILFFQDKKYYLYEIEIEAKTNSAVPDIKKILSSLLTSYGNLIHVWEDSKLATGNAMRALVSQKNFCSTLDKNNWLTLDSYQVIGEYLKNQQNNQ